MDPPLPSFISARRYGDHTISNVLRQAKQQMNGTQQPQPQHLSSVSSLLNLTPSISSKHLLSHDISTASISSTRSAQTVIGGGGTGGIQQQQPMQIQGGQMLQNNNDNNSIISPSSSLSQLHYSSIQHPLKPLRHSYSVPAHSTTIFAHSPQMSGSPSSSSIFSASAGSAAAVAGSSEKNRATRASPHPPPSHQTNHTSSQHRLLNDHRYTAPAAFTYTQLIPFIPRPLTPIKIASPLLTQWIAELAWEHEEYNRADGRSKVEEYQMMLNTLVKSCEQHEILLAEETLRDQTRIQALTLAHTTRLTKRKAMIAAAEQAERGLRRKAPVRFGGLLTSDETSSTEPLPSTLETPPYHTALVCDMLQRCVKQSGRVTKIMQEVLDVLLDSTYQGYTSGSDGQQQQQQRSLPSPPSSISSSTPSLSIVPYFHVSTQLNLEYHAGNTLIHNYIDTQQSMHIQGLRRSDILNSTIRKMETDLVFQVFVRWKEVVKQRKRQLKAYRKLFANTLGNKRHLHAHFLSWKLISYSIRSEKDHSAHTSAVNEAAALQVRSIDGRKIFMQEQEKHKRITDHELYLTREIDETKRSINHLENQRKVMNDATIHRLLDGTFDILGTALHGLRSELEVARSLQLQDPLRLLHPLRTTWEWDSVYQDTIYGSAQWFSLRKKEVEAARAFFDGSGIQYESALAFTHADGGNGGEQPKVNGGSTSGMNTPTANTSSHRIGSQIARINQRGVNHAAGKSPTNNPFDNSSPPSASLASASITPYNYSQEIELILLWANFHLIQAQRKGMEREQEKAKRRQQRAQQYAELQAQRESGVFGVGGGAGGKMNNSSSMKKGMQPSRSLSTLPQSPSAAPVVVNAFEVDSDDDDLSDDEGLSNIDDSLLSPTERASKRIIAQRAVLASSLEYNGDNNSISESTLKSRSYFLAQFTSPEALARRIENFTTSLQDSELILRLLCEIAPDTADTDMLTHIDLGSRARLLIRMIEKLNPDYTGMVTSLDFVHAFNSDRVAGLIARLMIDFPLIPIQGAWFDEKDYVNRNEREKEKERVKREKEAALASSNASSRRSSNKNTPVGTRRSSMTELDSNGVPITLTSAAAASPTSSSTSSSTNTLPPPPINDYGPLSILARDLFHLQHSLSNRTRLTHSQLLDFQSHLKTTLSNGRRILDDAYQRDDLWHCTKTRMKSFINAVFIAHLRGRPLKLDDPKAQKEREQFCALLETPMDFLWKKQRELKEQQVQKAAQEAQHAAYFGLEKGKESARALQQAVERFSKKEDDSVMSGSSAGDALASPISSPTASGANPTSATGDDTYYPHGKPQQRFMDLLSIENKTYYEDGSIDGRGGRKVNSTLASPFSGSTAGTNQSSPSSTDDSLTHILSFELHVIQNLLLLFYEPIRQIWKAYAQADPGGNANGAGAGAAGGGGTGGANTAASVPAGGAGAMGGSNTLNLTEFWCLIRDCGLSSSSTLTTKQVEQVFLEVFMTRKELQDKLGTIQRGLSTLLTLEFDSITGQPLPPKDKEHLELTEWDFIEVLVRIAYLRKPKNTDEREKILQEWKCFQQERVNELERERQRVLQYQQGQQGTVMTIDEYDTNTNTNNPSTSSSTSTIDNPLINNPLSKTMTGRRTTFNAQMHDGLAASILSPTNNGNNEKRTENQADETYGLDFSTALAAAAGTNDPLSPSSSFATSSLNLGLSLRFFGMLKLHLLPKATKLDPDTFRAQYKTIAVSKLFRIHGTILRKLFFKYATLHTVAVSVLDGIQADSWSNTIDYQEFCTMLHDLHLLLDNNSGLGGKEASKMLLTYEQAYSIFANVQQELHITNSNVVNTNVQMMQARKEKQLNSEGSATAATSVSEDSTAKKKEGKKKSTTAATGSKKKKTTSKKSKKKSTSASSSSEQADDLSSISSKITILPSTREEDTDDEDGEKKTTSDPTGESDAGENANESTMGEEEDVNEEEEEEDVNSTIGDEPTGSVPITAAAAAPSQVSDISEACYPEFLESLAAIACFRYPHPYKSCADKIFTFLETDLLPFIPKLLKRVHHSDE